MPTFIMMVNWQMQAYNIFSKCTHSKNKKITSNTTVNSPHRVNILYLQKCSIQTNINN